MPRRWQASQLNRTVGELPADINQLPGQRPAGDKQKASIAGTVLALYLWYGCRHARLLDGP